MCDLIVIFNCLWWSMCYMYCYGLCCYMCLIFTLCLCCWMFSICLNVIIIIWNICIYFIWQIVFNVCFILCCGLFLIFLNICLYDVVCVVCVVVVIIKQIKHTTTTNQIIIIIYDCESHKIINIIYDTMILYDNYYVMLCLYFFSYN